ncbi:hypothetical protein HDK64DRAFT_338761 [Phyllosticta capitalensis]
MDSQKYENERNRLPRMSPSRQTADLSAYENNRKPLPRILPSRQTTTLSPYCPDSPSPTREPVDPITYEEYLRRRPSRSPTPPPRDRSRFEDVLGRLRSSQALQAAATSPAQSPSPEPRERTIIRMDYVLNRDVLKLALQNLRENGPAVGADWLALQIYSPFAPVVVNTASEDFTRIKKYWVSACRRDESIPEKGGRLVIGVYKMYDDGFREGYHTDQVSDEDVYRAVPRDSEVSGDEDEVEGELENEVVDEADFKADTSVIEWDQDEVQEEEAGDEIEEEVKSETESMTVIGDEDDFEVDSMIFVDDDEISTACEGDELYESQYPNQVQGQDQMEYSPTSPITIRSSHPASTPRGPSPSPQADTPIPTIETEYASDVPADNNIAVSEWAFKTITLGSLRQTIRYKPEDRATTMQRLNEYYRFCDRGHNPHRIKFEAFVAVRNFTLAHCRGSRK